MSGRLQRSITEPIREGLSWDALWLGPDNGLIWCWERGRQERLDRPSDAARAEGGELVPLDWKGGVRKKLKLPKVHGSLNYLATWQGLRGEDLNIDPVGERTLVCSKHGQTVVFTPNLPKEEEVTSE
jgi:hypothetical protein